MWVRLFLIFTLGPYCANAFAQAVSETFFGHDLLQIPYASWAIWLLFTLVGIALRYDIEAGVSPVDRGKFRSMMLRGLFAGFIAFAVGELYRSEARPLPGVIQGMIITIAAMYSRETIAKMVRHLDNRTNGEKK